MDKTSADFTTVVHGKWILAGEHAVLRGHPAIIFPIKSKSLILSHYASNEEVRAEFGGEYGDELQFLFWSGLERAIEILDIHHSDVLGKFHLENNIPVGAGMGASAAICVAIGRWFVNTGKVTQENLLEFSRQLENLFHNESSGADIAVAIMGEGILFSRSGALHELKPKWTPQWYLSYSGKVSTTSRCVKKVKELWGRDSKLAAAIDEEMANCVSIAEKALQMTAGEGLKILANAIQIGKDCFHRWGLIDSNVNQHIEQLLNAGALAAKPTGAGDGGFILSLWDKAPKKGRGIELIGV